MTYGLTTVDSIVQERKTETCNNRKTEDRKPRPKEKLRIKKKDLFQQKHTDKNEDHKSFRLISSTNVKLNITPK